MISGGIDQADIAVRTLATILGLDPLTMGQSQDRFPGRLSRAFPGLILFHVLFALVFNTI